MRLTPSQLRNAVMDPSYRVPTGPQTGGPSTDSALRGAIRVVHSAGPEAARDALTRSLVSKYWRSGRGLTMAGNARAALDTYIRLNEGETREAFDGKTLTYETAGDQIAVNIDVVLLDNAGYTARMCLPGPLSAALTAEQRTLVAAPALLALVGELEDQFDAGIVREVEVWELRSGRTGVVPRGAAELAVPSIEVLLRRLRT